MKKLTFSGLLCLALLSGCSDSSQQAAAKPSPQAIEFAETATPADERLAGIYARSCQTCHAVYGMGAPLTGHAEGWAQRMTEKGVDGLVATTKSGIRAMPSMGLCQDCSDDDFAALIQFMAGETN